MSEGPEDARQTFLRAVKDEEERRICEAYGVTSVQSEILYRLRAGRSSDTTALGLQEAEMRRLRAHGNELRVLAQAAATVAVLDAVNPLDDVHWSISEED